MVSRVATFVFFFLHACFLVLAQPTLPDISGVAGKDVIVLSWNCQYANVKAISVFRSSDSSDDFALIGYVGKISKGLQTFTDDHPHPGNNCYNVVVGFRSGLTWRSNHYCVRFARYALESEKHLIPNPIPHVPDTSARAVTRMEPVNAGKPAPQSQIETPKPAQPKIKLPSFATDTVENPYAAIRSKYIFTDERTGLVDMFLPGDVATHHYSVKFYDLQNHLITEVPRIYTAKIIFDKRNFERKKICRFVLRKDGIELEEGYITPNP